MAIFSVFLGGGLEGGLIKVRPIVKPASQGYAPVQTLIILK